MVRPIRTASMMNSEVIRRIFPFLPTVISRQSDRGRNVCSCVSKTLVMQCMLQGRFGKLRFPFGQDVDDFAGEEVAVTTGAPGDEVAIDYHVLVRVDRAHVFDVAV